MTITIDAIIPNEVLLLSTKAETEMEIMTIRKNTP